MHIDKEKQIYIYGLLIVRCQPDEHLLTVIPVLGRPRSNVWDKMCPPIHCACRPQILLLHLSPHTPDLQKK